MVGTKIEDFSAAATEGPFHLADHAGHPVVLYFYPKDNTPGCTTQACDLRDSAPAFKKKKSVVVGVSPDSIASHGKFRDKFNLNFLLLADPDHKIAEKYGAWGDKVLYGKKYKGIIRSTFVIDEKGKVKSAHYKVSPKGHAAAMLEAL